MKKTIVIINGDIHDYQWHKQIIEPDDYVICADGGTYHALKMDIIPQMIVGDFDSLNEFIIEALERRGTLVRRLKVDKDEVDSEIALQLAMEERPEQIWIMGALSDRIDYNISNIHLLVPLLQQGMQACLINEHYRIFLVSPECPGVIRAPYGTRLSIMPLSSDVTGITIKGFKYALNDDRLPLGVSWGMSNVLLADEGTITLRRGIAVVFQEHDQGSLAEG